MASLTGQSISTTYDSLLKLADNGPITSSFKEITDGLGNSSKLYIRDNGGFGFGAEPLNNGADLNVGITSSTWPEFSVFNSTTKDYISLQTVSTFSIISAGNSDAVNYNDLDFYVGGTGKLKIKTTGQLNLSGYTSTSSFTGTVAGYLAFTSAGNIITTSAPGGGISSLNALTASTQTFAIGTSGTDFGISSATSTHTFNLPTASATNRGALSSADWSTFNGKQNALTLTVTGSSGAATLVGATLNIPTYTLAGLGGVPTSRTITINGTTFDLSADRSWTIAGAGISTLNTLTAGTQTFAVGTSGTDFNISSATSTHTFNIPNASDTARGLITSAAQTIGGSKTFTSAIVSQTSIDGTGGWKSITSSSNGTINSTTFTLLATNVVNYKQFIYASGATLSSNANFANLMLASSTLTEAATGTHAIVSQLAIKPIVLTDNSGTTTNAATVYIEGATSGTATITNNYAVWVDSGDVRIDGNLLSTTQFNAQAGTSYTLVLSDWGKVIEMQSGSANTVTIPTNASVPFPIGTEIQVMQYGAGQTTIGFASGVTSKSKSNYVKIANQNTGVTLLKRATDDWYIIGNLGA